MPTKAKAAKALPTPLHENGKIVYFIDWTKSKPRLLQGEIQNSCTYHFTEKDGTGKPLKKIERTEYNVLTKYGIFDDVSERRLHKDFIPAAKELATNFLILLK